MAKNKHLTPDERLKIEHWLKQRTSIKKMAANLGKSVSTISREIRKRSVASDKSAPGRIPNRCVQRYSCTVRSLCYDKPDCIRVCRSCKFCNDLCQAFEEEVCPKLSSPPYVCNGCGEEQRCTLRKVYYIHGVANKDYRKLLVDSRSGVNLSEEELLQLDAFVSPLIRQGQSIHHITVNNPDELTVSKKSIYRYVAGGLLQARNIDMPRICRLRPRKSKPLTHKVDPKCRIGRSYPDFQSFMDLHNAPAVVEMDSVLGRIGGKVLLTLMFKSCDFMLAFLRDRNTSKSVIEVFTSLYHLVGYDLFCQLFPVLVTDNGSEFSNPRMIEFDPDGQRRTYVFYCDPYASFQKPNVELNHVFIRRILPKGSSFDWLTQSDINLMMSHINSYSREKLGDKSPNNVFSFLYNLSPELFGIQSVPPNEIILNPSLLKRHKQ